MRTGHLVVTLACVLHLFDSGTIAASVVASKVVTQETPDTQMLPFSCNTTVEAFQCDVTTCIPTSSACNGIIECPNGLDESVSVCGCLPNEFRCRNSCVDLVKRCNRKKDCEEGEDEEDCKTFLCPTTHFKCSNHYCIPLDSVCDFKDDCGDNSDELKCVRRKCWNPEFKCDSGECIRPGFLCDGNPDCKDGSDESPDTCHPRKFVQCGDGTRIHKYYWCDGWPDCIDNHADELNCEECDGENDFKCPNGRCIRKANVCDSQCDCVNSYNNSLNYYYDKVCADEVNCTHSYKLHQGTGAFECELGSTLGCSTPGSSHTKSRCIAPQFLCDGVNDCHNGDFYSDEFGCPNNQKLDSDEVYQCRDNRSLPKKLRCDFNIDCLNGDDEEDCPGTQICQENEYQCGNGQCIPKSGYCNLAFDCYDRSDESDCYNNICAEEMLRCATGQCLPEDQWCDFFIDCLDASDETNCTIRECRAGEFKCDNGQCVSSSQKCYNSGNPRTGCADRSHLLNCHDWVCAENQFKCHQGPCLNVSLICDGSIDCPGSWNDEDNCTFSCSNSAPQCECHDVMINCTGKGLTEMPDAEKEITSFHLGSNDLGSTLNNETFLNLDRLLYLDLSDNNIAYLMPHMFCNLWRLSILNLQNNRISFLGNGSFYGLFGVSGLYLQGNQIQKIQTMAFIGLSSLTFLDLHGQRISQIEPSAFVGLRNLAGLDLSQNDIRYLEEGILHGMHRLLSL